MRCKKAKSYLCNNQKGFSLIEIMVALGMLGIISLGTMQLMTNMTKGQKGMTFKSNIDQIVNEVKMAMRTEANCTATLTGLSPSTSTQPVNDNEIKKNCESAGGVISNCTTLISIDQIIGGGSGANVRITDITHTGSALNGATDETGTGTISISMQLTDSSGDALDSNKIFGSSTIRRDISTSYNNGGAGTEITACTGDSTTYAEIACDKIGGTFLKPDGPCTAVKISGYSAALTEEGADLNLAEKDQISITAKNNLLVEGGSAVIERNLFVGPMSDFDLTQDTSSEWHIFTKGGILSEGNIYANASVNIEDVLNIEGAIVFNQDKSSILYNSSNNILLVGSALGTKTGDDIHSGNDIYSSKNIYAHDGQIETASYHISSGGNETEVISNDREITALNINIEKDATGVSIEATGDIKTKGNIYLAAQSDDGSLQEVATKAYVNKLLFVEMTDAEKQQVIIQMLSMFENTGMQDIYIYFKQKLAEADTELADAAGTSPSGSSAQSGCPAGEKIKNIFWHDNGTSDPVQYKLVVECIDEATEAQEILNFLYASCDEVAGQDFIRLQRTACPCSSPNHLIAYNAPAGTANPSDATADNYEISSPPGTIGSWDRESNNSWDLSRNPFAPLITLIRENSGAWDPFQNLRDIYILGKYDQDGGVSCGTKLGNLPGCDEITVGGICEGDGDCAGDTSNSASNCGVFDVYVRIR